MSIVETQSSLRWLMVATGALMTCITIGVAAFLIALAFPPFCHVPPHATCRGMTIMEARMRKLIAGMKIPVDEVPALSPG